MKVKELIEYLNTLDGELELVKPVYVNDMFEGYEEFDLYNLETEILSMTVGEIGNKDFYIDDGFGVACPNGYSSVPDGAVRVKVAIV